MCECFTQLIILRTSSRAGTDSASWLRSCEKQRRANTGEILWSFWKATSRTGSTIASTLYLKWKGERIPVRSLWKATSKIYPWVGCSLKSRGLQQAESRFLCKAGSQLVQGRQARPRIICGPASHLPTSYLRPAGHNIGFARLLRPLLRGAVCVTIAEQEDRWRPRWPGSTWAHLAGQGPPDSTWVHLGPPGHLCCSSSDHLITWSTIRRITNSYFFLFQ